MSNFSGGWQCPLPLQQHEHILMAHGGGGRLTQQLFRHMIRPILQNEWLEQAHDGAVLPAVDGRSVMTTDSFVIRPIFFAGGDIGTLAVCGTVNDLAMCGAIPRYLSLSLILDEGLPLERLAVVLQSIGAAARAAGVQIVTGDTKVIECRDEPGLLINTTGFGELPVGRDVQPGRICPGDAILLSGDVGRHGIAVMAQREGLSFETEIQSDVALLNSCVEALFAGEIDVHCLRDLTRGGMATALFELGEASHTTLLLEEKAIPVEGQVKSACELLGLDPLYVANEGRFVAIVPKDQTKAALKLLHAHPLGQNAQLIGQVQPQQEVPLLLQSNFGTRRILSLLNGDPLPRIC